MATCWDKKLYPPTKIQLIYDALVMEPDSASEVPDTAGLKGQQVHSAVTLVSLTQILAAYSAAMKLARNPMFAFHSGRSFRITHARMFLFVSYLCFLTTLMVRFRSSIILKSL